MQFICPVCGQALVQEQNSFKCENRHSFDRSKYGYVNLLMSQRSSAKHSGDDKLMVKARTAFLDKGYYDPLRDAVVGEVVKYRSEIKKILDVGCGECWYTAAVFNALGADTAGIDISKDALIAGAKRCHELSLAVASVTKLPVADSSVDLVMNMFAPVCEKEFARVLRNGGFLLRAVVLEHHLFGLKQAVYENPYENPPPDIETVGFEILNRCDIKYRIKLDSNEDIVNLFKMTPYYYKTSREDQQKLNELNSLETEIGFGLILYKRKEF